MLPIPDVTLEAVVLGCFVMTLIAQEAVLSPLVDSSLVSKQRFRVVQKEKRSPNIIETILTP